MRDSNVSWGKILQKKTGAVENQGTCDKIECWQARNVVWKERQTKFVPLDGDVDKVTIIERPSASTKYREIAKLKKTK